MEIKINKEIRNYKESMFFGLSMRQFIFSVLAMGVAVLLYFGLKPYVGAETVSWMCILGAAPFAAMGFFTYHGMPAEQFFWVLIRFAILEPRSLKFRGINYYEQAIDTKQTAPVKAKRSAPAITRQSTSARPRQSAPDRTRIAPAKPKKKEEIKSARKKKGKHEI